MLEKMYSVCTAGSADSVVCSLQSSVCSLQSARLIIDCPVDMYCARHLSDISFSVRLHFFCSNFAFTHPIHLWAASEERAALLLGSSASTFMWRPCFFGQTMKYLNYYFFNLFFYKQFSLCLQTADISMC